MENWLYGMVVLRVSDHHVQSELRAVYRLSPLVESLLSKQLSRNLNRDSKL